ncbi:MAG: HEAT repeat domain-containing protein [Planctomycetes bacterium]|nr:HEAT repeat domain-containing protein [Planctomycetota bacterium]
MMTQPPRVYQVLLAAENRAADDVLLSALSELDPDHAAYAVDTLLKRQEPQALRHLINDYHELPGSCKARLEKHLPALESVLREAIRCPKEQPRLNTIDLVASGRSCSMAYLLSMGLRSASFETRAEAASALRELTYHTTPYVEEGAFDTDWLIGLEDRYREFALVETDQGLLATALSEALVDYDTHRRLAVVEAIGMLSLHLEQELGVQACKPQSKFWWAVLDRLTHDPHPCLAALTLQALAMKQLRSPIAKIISKCRTDEFMTSVIRHSWMLGDAAIRAGCRSITRLAWMEDGPRPILELSAADLQRAVRFFECTRIPEAQRIEWYKAILLSDHQDKRAVVLFALAGINNEESSEVLHVLVDWADPKLAGIATRVLLARREIDAPNDAGRYRSRNTAEETPASGQKRYADFEQYWNGFDHMSEPLRLLHGRRLLSHDPRFLESLGVKLRSHDAGGTAADRARAINIIRHLSLVEYFREGVVDCALDPDRFVRSTAVKAVGQLRTPASERLLSEALRDPDRRVRANAIEALDQTQSPRRAEQVRPSLADSDHRVRAAAIKTLLKLQVREAAEELLRMLDHPSRAHRASALWVIEKHGLAGIANRVASMAENDPDEMVRRRARRMWRAEKRARRNRDVPIPPPKEGHEV